MKRIEIKLPCFDR